MDQEAEMPMKQSGKDTNSKVLHLECKHIRVHSVQYAVNLHDGGMVGLWLELPRGCPACIHLWTLVVERVTAILMCACIVVVEGRQHDGSWEQRSRLSRHGLTWLLWILE